MQAPLAESVSLPGSHHRLVIRAPEIAAAAQPGQFLHVWCHDPAELDRPPAAAILRRPFSISRTGADGTLEILLRVRGTGGRWLAAKRAGNSLDVIGPLGRGFSVSPDLKVAIVVAGGIGVAPAPLLVDRLVVRGVRVVLLVGAADDTRIPFAVERCQPGRAAVPELEAMGAEVTFVSEAVEGLLVSEVLEARLEEFRGEAAAVFAVGPRAMLKRLMEVTEGCLPMQVSLEERMACGLGACRSCVVPARGQDVAVGQGHPRPLSRVVYRTVCRDGPVFQAAEVAWEVLAT